MGGEGKASLAWIGNGYFFLFIFLFFIYLYLLSLRAKDWKDFRSISFDSVRNFERSEFIFGNYSRFHSFLFVVIQILFF